MGISKVVYGNKTLIDLTSDTLTADKMLAGVTGHGADGEKITGTCDYDVNSQDATVKVAEMLVGKTGYARGELLTGTMPNNSGTNYTISTASQVVTIPQGYTDGTTKVQIAAAELAKIVPQNIRENVTILGQKGTMSGSEDSKPQAKTVTPSSTAQTVIPDEGYNCLSQVTVKAINYVETDNSAGGKTVTIG